jgi:hemerythrin-like metal-binding protein
MSDGLAESSPILEWSDALSVGNAAIDNDHKAFIELAKLLRSFDKESKDYKVIIQSALLMLEEYVAGHFLREEKSMRQISFKHFNDHLNKHNMFRLKIKETIHTYNAGVVSVIDGLPDLVSKWLINHIAHDDMKFKMLIPDGSVDSRPLAFLAVEAQETNKHPQTAAPAPHSKTPVNRQPSLSIDFSKVRALICEPSNIIRSGIRLALNELGVCDIDEANSFMAINKACEEGRHQLMIMNHEIDGNDATYFIRQVRSLKTNSDPFILIFLLLSSRDETTVRSVMNSGSDSLLLIPFSTGQLKDQIKGQVERRKPFIVTQEYIGPERRNDPRPGGNSAPQIPVPNPVQAWGMSVPLDQYERAKNEAIQTIAIARVKSLASAIDYECNALTVSVRDNTASNQSSFRSLSNLENATEELLEKATKYTGIAPNGVGAFRQRCQELKANPQKITFGDVEALATAGRQITGNYVSR